MMNRLTYREFCEHISNMNVSVVVVSRKLEEQWLLDETHEDSFKKGDRIRRSRLRYPFKVRKGNDNEVSHLKVKGEKLPYLIEENGTPERTRKLMTFNDLRYYGSIKCHKCGGNSYRFNPNRLVEIWCKDCETRGRIVMFKEAQEIFG